MSRHGIGPAVWEKLLHTAFSYPEVSAVILYGSRARGDYRQGSDIDIAIDAPDMSKQRFASLWQAIDDLPIIYPLDVLHLQQSVNTAIYDSITREGIRFSRPTDAPI